MQAPYEGTIFLASGFSAKYPEGGGNFSVPLQWALGLKRLGVSFYWMEILPASGDAVRDRHCIEYFEARMRDYGIPYVLLFQHTVSEEQDIAQFDFYGMDRRSFEELLGKPTTLLNLSYSIHPPFALRFERRVYCNLDPTEICYWMARMEMGQSSHTEFWTIGLNTGAPDSRITAPPEGVKWQTFYPLVDTEFLRKEPRPEGNRFTTIGQWYWNGYFELEDGWRDFSKRAVLEPYIDLPSDVPEITWELAMHMNADDPEQDRLRTHGWRHVFPHDVVPSPEAYYHYLKGSLAEFTPVKVDNLTHSGWLSDRAVAYLAMGRPVITEATGAEKYLPEESGFLWVKDRESATEAARRVLRDWERLSILARECAVECFDSVRNLRKILEISLL